jgi:hypothetical protein
MKRLLPFLVAAPFLSGCALVAAGAVGAGAYVVSQKDDAYVSEVPYDVDHVWPSVQETMGFLQEPGSQPLVQEFPRAVDAKVSGAKVRVEVEAMDIDRTTIRVSAEKYLAKDEATAEDVIDQILKRLGKT